MKIGSDWVDAGVDGGAYMNDDTHHQCSGLYDSHYISKGIIPGTSIPQWWLEWSTGHKAVTECPECGKELTEPGS